MNDKEVLDILNEVFDGWGDLNFYQWKYNNGFGKKIIKVERLGEEIVSVRLFMPWGMYCDDVYFSCYQATDSATKKSARGKGLFKTLTVRALNELKDTEFVFNFPNANSINIYLKLGWKVECRKKAIYIPTINLFKGQCACFPQENSVLKTIWDKDSLEWRLGNKKQYETFSYDNGSVIFRKLKVKGILTADVLKTDDTITIPNVKEFMSFLSKQRIGIIRYIGHNTTFDNIIQNNLLFSFAFGREVNMVSYNLPKGNKLRLEMIDADYT
ncbi:GNAT family N-acetyltransferase [Vibrio cyclitrophicus]